MQGLRVIALSTFLFSHIAGAQGARVTRTKRGDTTVVTSSGNGAWGPLHDAVELKRFNAETKETTFGSAFTLAATSDGGVAVFDPKSLDGPIIRRFDAEGKFTHNVGRRGSGPGEYELGLMAIGSLSMTARSDGSLIVREASRAVLRYGSDGRYLNGFMLYYTNGSTNEIVAVRDGTFWVRAAFPSVRGPMQPGPRPMVHYDSAGKILDSLTTAPSWVAANVDASVAREWWAPIPDGRVIHTRTDKIGFLLHDVKNATPPVIAEIVRDPVRYSPEERKEQEGLADFSQAMPRQGPPPPRRVVGDTKPISGGASVDVNGRIWVYRPGPGEKTKPQVAASYGGRAGNGQFMVSYQDQTIYTAFAPDGTLLGEVKFPAGARVSFVGNFAWALIRDEDDTPILVKYRIAN